ncbi:DNA polymerase nu-like [Denticeps clupeoides]|uniref:DNA polymerase nu-like n=1 Tax=Denticeps clupeoides TaxID=299321 RepID=UPI0010A4BE4E|nr:DNA polymerase nu-like [Denticeps clupeoides]
MEDWWNHRLSAPAQAVLAALRQQHAGCRDSSRQSWSRTQQLTSRSVPVDAGPQWEMSSRYHHHVPRSTEGQFLTRPCSHLETPSLASYTTTQRKQRHTDSHGERPTAYEDRNFGNYCNSRDKLTRDVRSRTDFCPDKWHVGGTRGDRRQPEKRKEHCAINRGRLAVVFPRSEVAPPTATALPHVPPLRRQAGVSGGGRPVVSAAPVSDVVELPECVPAASSPGSGTSTKRKSSGGTSPLSPKREKPSERDRIHIHFPAPHRPQQAHAAPRLSLPLTSDPCVCDAGRLTGQERRALLEEASRARALVLTMVYQDGSTQLDPEQKDHPCMSGILVLIKAHMDLACPESGAEGKLVYLRLEKRLRWAQKEADQNPDTFTRDLMMLVLSADMQVVCYKAKDLLRSVLQHFTHTLSWKQVGLSQVLDPQIAAWLLDPADSASCFQELVDKHCPQTPGSLPPRHSTPSLSQVAANLHLLYRLMFKLRSRLQVTRLWGLYSQMEHKMIPILAAMESYRIHVDREALKKTSGMLGSKLKQLEQEAHLAAGQQFLVSSNTQLRTVLFEKLRLHDRCEQKKLPKTLLTQQQSTSEAVLLQLQDLHPLPMIVLEYRQVHKIKSTFVDGILSCTSNMAFVSPTWNQTRAVSGRLSARHPNFQALPRQSLMISKKQYVQGKGAELVTVHPRAMFIPRPGWTFLSADFCQVELRLLAHLSSDPELLRIFSDPSADIFSMLASKWKGMSEDSVGPGDRDQAKRVVYSVVYGAGRERLSGILGVSTEQARLLQDTFLQTYGEVQPFIQRTIQQCQRQGYVASIMGHRRSLPNILSPDRAKRNQSERQAVNFVVQGSAADLCKMAMIQIFSHVASSPSLTARLLAQIHDELLFEVEEKQLLEVAALVKSTMESLQHIDLLGVHLKVPLKVALSCGPSWGSMTELTLPRPPRPED